MRVAAATLVLFVATSLIASDQAYSAPTVKKPSITTRLIRLKARSFIPKVGVDSSLLTAAKDAAAKGVQYIHCVAQLPNGSSPGDWDALNKRGIRYSAYLGESNWVVQIHLANNAHKSLLDAKSLLGAVALTILNATDRVAPTLRASLSLVKDGKPIKVTALFFPTANEQEASALVRAAADNGAPISKTASNGWEFSISARSATAQKALDLLTAYDGLHFLSDGPSNLPLMDGTRAITGADTVQHLIGIGNPPVYGGFTGAGVKLSNSEGLNTDHDDFWTHDAAGNRVSQRWVGNQAGSSHGYMTAGIMLGNGWMSSASGGVPYQWRGMSPEATLVPPNSGEDAQNMSFVQTYGPYDSFSALLDSEIRGDGPTVDFHPIVYAVGNQGIEAQYGIEKGYYSVYAPNKNSIVVAKLDKYDLHWAESSIGPTWDGRIKPDISAPGQGESWPIGKAQEQFKIDYIKLSGGSSLQWDFSPGSNWAGGWGQPVVNCSWFPNVPNCASSWFTMSALATPVSQGSSGGVNFLGAAMGPPPWTDWDSAPMIGTLTAPNGTSGLAITGNSSDIVKIRYSIGPEPFWKSPIAWLGFSKTGGNAFPYTLGSGMYIPFPVIADGAWHEATIPVGSYALWANSPNGSIGYLDIRFANMAGMETTGCCESYNYSGGSSAAAPVVTGALGLLLQQTKVSFGAVLGDHSPSPFYVPGAGQGIPLSSTFKAILVHTADDLASTPRANDPINPDTGAPTVYYKGPDLPTGYGELNVGEASRLIAAQHSQPSLNYIRENFFKWKPGVAPTTQTYSFVVPLGQTDPVRVTLAWDDAPGSPAAADPVARLVNDLDLEVVGPDNVTHYPWTIDQPYQPLLGPPNLYPGAAEPEPITAASIKPARRDLPDHLNNIEQVYAELPAPGTWTIRVKPTSLNSAGLQTYSLVTGMPPRSVPDLNCGKVVFASDRLGADQIYVKHIGAAGLPVKITQGIMPRHPAWSPDGRFVAYVDRTVVTNNNQMDALIIVTETGALAGFIPAGVAFNPSDGLGYPQWSRDGKKIVITTVPNGNWSARNLKVIEFNTAYVFNGSPGNGYNITTAVPSGTGAGNADFSPDGQFLYYNSDSGTLGTVWRVPVVGGTSVPVYTNAAQITRGYSVSISPDGRKMIYNSELWKDDPVNYLDEELLQADLLTGVGVPLTHEPGNQYGRFAKGGAGEYAMQSNTTASGKTDIFLAADNARVKLDVGDPNNIYNDGQMDWWKPASGCRRSAGGGTHPEN